MNRLTYGNVKGTIGAVLNLCTTDTRLMSIVNQAQERLLYKGKYVGTYGRYRVCINESCITLPRQLETVEAIAICDRPGTVRGEWFEFLDAGPGVLKETNDIGDQIVDRGEACAFDDVRGSFKRLAVYTSLPEAAGAVINLQYYDENGEFVRTSYGGQWIEGENVALAAAGGYSYATKLVASLGLVRVVKPVTNGVIRLYEYDTVNLTYKPLGYYEPDETVPVYRRYMIPNMASIAGTGDCTTASVTLMGKMRFIPVSKDADFLMINSIGALKLMCQAVQKEEFNLWQEATAYEANALRLLDEQLKHYKGDGEIQPIAWLNNEITGPAVPNLI